MIPQTHRQETLHRVFVSAIAAHAGIKTEWKTGVEYGIDGTFQLVTEHSLSSGETALIETGFPLNIQLKSTVGCRFLRDDLTVSYDCDATAYNKMVTQNAAVTVPIILIVLCLPSVVEEWVDVNENELKLRGGCYWYYVTGAPTIKGKTIRIPRSQLFTAKALKDLMDKIQSNGGRL